MQGPQGAFGTAGHGAAQVGMGAGRAAAGHDEIFQRWQVGVEPFQPFVQRQHVGVFHQFMAGHGQFAAQVEQLLLCRGEPLVNGLGQWVGQDQPDHAVEFVHLAHGVYAQVVLGQAVAGGEAGGAGVTGAGGDF